MNEILLFYVNTKLLSFSWSKLMMEKKINIPEAKNGQFVSWLDHKSPTE